MSAGAARPAVVVYTQEYPTPNDPTDGLFTQQLADALACQVPVTVVCPVPWFPAPDVLLRRAGWVSARGIPRRLQRGETPVHYPLVPLVPVVTRAVQPQIQALCTLPLLRSLRRAGRLDVLNAHSVYPDGIAAAWLSDWVGVPLVLTAIGSDINANLGHPARLRAIRRALRRASVVVGVSTALCEVMRGLETGARIVRVPNGVDRGRFRPASGAAAPPEPLGDERPIVLFVGRLHPVKGLDVLLEAVGRVRRQGRPPFQVVVVGEGPEAEALLRQRAAFGIDQDVRFIGVRGHDAVGEWMRAAAVFCLPSRNEGMPNVLIEAQACGVPVVATRVGGVGELVGPDSGILVDAGDAPALAAALVRATAGAWSATRVAEQVAWADWDQSASRYVEIFRESAGTA